MLKKTTFIFKDNLPGQEPKTDYHNSIPDLITALEKIRSTPNLDVFHIGTQRRIVEKDPVSGNDIFPQIRIEESRQGAIVGGIPTKIKVDVGHFVGIYQWSGKSCKTGELMRLDIEVRPRFGDTVFNYLLAHATGIYRLDEPKGATLKRAQSNPLWLLAFMWKAALEAAITKCHIPRSYVSAISNTTVLRGRLNFARQIRTNIVHQHRFDCDYRKLTTDNTLNRTIRYTYTQLVKFGFKEILADLRQYDHRLASYGVQLPVRLELKELDGITYNKMNVAYQPVMELSRIILRHESAAASFAKGRSSSFSYFVDISEVWENYLIKILRRFLSTEYRIVSGNHDCNEFLLNGENRRLIPDILLYHKDHKDRPIAVIDAKYKNYRKFGSKHGDDISREDMFQMITYLQHFAGVSDHRSLFGVFVCPTAGEFSTQERKYYSLTYNQHIKLALMGIDLNAPNNDPKYLQEAERTFCRDLQTLIS